MTKLVSANELNLNDKVKYKGKYGVVKLMEGALGDNYRFKIVYLNRSWPMPVFRRGAQVPKYQLVSEEEYNEEIAILKLQN